jgi:thiopeptide-type bacteriocin biosynthesis protein
MPDDQLTRSRAGKEQDQVASSSTPHETANSVLAVLAGVPISQAAARIHMNPADLADAVEVYQAAGYAALQAQAADRGWYQARVQFTEWDTAEHTAATGLGPHLTQMHDQGVATAWWFIRKAPCWRLRLLPGPAATSIKAAVRPVLDGLMARGLIEGWQETIYEPESAAFGGPAGMDIAHALFHADSRAILDYARRPAPVAPGEPAIGRRELSVLLCATLLRSAGQDWYEQGDIWHRVAQLRPLPPDTPAGRLPELASSLRRLMTADTRPAGALVGPNGPLASAAPWIAAFDAAGRTLGGEAASGTLERGVRGILAHHVIFHWNRLGLTDTTQGILARAAHDTVMGQADTSPSTRPADGQ